MKSSPRSQKVAGMLAELLPPLVEKHRTPNQVGLCSVTAVEVSGDLSVADVFVDAIGAPADFVEALQKVSPKLEHKIAKTLKLRRKMTLRWKRDPAPLHAKKIEELMKNS